MKKRLLVTLIPAVACLAIATPALAATQEAASENWAGYVVRPRAPVASQRVSGAWTEPSVSCSAAGESTYSAYWVGLGGGGQQSQALEQIGTQADCSSNGSGEPLRLVRARAIGAREDRDDDQCRRHGMGAHGGGRGPGQPLHQGPDDGPGVQQDADDDGRRPGYEHGRMGGRGSVRMCRWRDERTMHAAAACRLRHGDVLRRSHDRRWPRRHDQ